MDDLREKVILGIGYSLVNDSVVECTNAKCEFINCRELCLEWLLRNALSLLKAQEPRVMTLEEVKAMDRLTYCVIEPHSKVIKNTFNAEYGGIVTLGTENFLDFGLYGDTNRYRRTESGYGKTWRCWTSRPTDEQREATPWN